MSDESHWIEKAQAAEARAAAYAGQIDRLKDKVRRVCDGLAARETADGGFVIDYEAFVRRLGLAGALELRAVIDEVHAVSGAPGDKPRVRVKAA